MAKQVVTRTYTASIRNQSRVQDDLDSLGFGANQTIRRAKMGWTGTKSRHVSNHNELTT